jgi:DNA gyrase subunit B
MAFVTHGVTITLRDERAQPIPREMTFYFEGGLRSFVRYLNRNRNGLHEPVFVERDVEIVPEEGNGHKPFTIGVEVAFQYTDSSTTTELYFANTILTPDGHRPGRTARRHHPHNQSVRAQNRAAQGERRQLLQQ